MIFPFLDGFSTFTKAPVTWMIFFLNGFVFVLSSFFSNISTPDLSDDFYRIQGRLYANYIQSQSELFPESSPLYQLSLTSGGGSSQNEKILGQLSLRDQTFLSQIAVEKPDSVEKKFAQRWLARMNEVEGIDPAYFFGFSSATNFWVSIWTYQFAHGGFFHFFANMIYLFIFGSWIEKRLSSVTYLSLYLVSGATAAWAFLWMGGPTHTALVGASGAISGLIGFFAVRNGMRPVRFLYWVLPAQGYSGYALLPWWTAALSFLIADIAGLVSTPNFSGGIAHSAHLGGFIFGAAFAGALSAYPSLYSQPSSAEHKSR